MFAGAVEQLAVGAILLDEHGHFLKANLLASQLLEEKDGLQVRQRQLELSDVRVGRELKTIIQRVLDNGRNNQPAVVQALRVQRPSGRPDLGLLVRLVPQYAWSEGQHGAGGRGVYKRSGAAR